jgi:L-alanine-DL-glutamate epimerase-like enolase superfamily enzyme
VRVTRIDTLTSEQYLNALWVQIHTDEGLVGLGEQWYWQAESADYIHGTVAPYLLGQDPRVIEHHHRTLRRPLVSPSRDARWSGLSAVDVALWDIFGQSVGLPIYALLGGPVRERIRIYNTCVGYGHNARRSTLPSAQTAAAQARSGPYEDQTAWQEDEHAAELALSLLEQGITAMKIWPFDLYREESDGQQITAAQVDAGMRPLRQIREAVGLKMDLLIEMHASFHLQAAIRIARALEEIEPIWYEDPIREMENLDALVEFARSTRVPTAASETLAGRRTFRDLLEKRAAGIVLFDPGWVGGITEAHFIASLAATYDRPFAPHDCTGPVVYTVGTHLCMAAPNALIQEGVRANYLDGWYGEVLTDLPGFDHGFVSAPSGPGLGTRLQPDFARRADVVVRSSSL